jgi:hypothetical protein
MQSASDQQASTAIPAYLNTPPLTAVNPPAVTRDQALPFGELAWEDFERLCLRLARSEAEVIHCQLYGTPGQKQEGIDLYVKLALNNEYRVYQCKRENDFGASKIRKAVDKFLDGAWGKKAKTLVLCTKESLIATNRANEVEAQRERLTREGVALIPWDSLQLSLMLKGQPELVDDFFGRPWVAAFLGDEAAARLGHRLDAADVVKFRKNLGAFYSRVFAQHDPGLLLAGHEHSATLTLGQRYVVPDVFESRAITSAQALDAQQLASEPREPRDAFVRDQAPRAPSQRKVETLRERINAGDWLARSARVLVLGGPGSGKSSLLRFLATDLLGDAPSLQTVAERWGTYLPVWLPFPFWTQLVATEGKDACSLTEVLRLWLRSWDEDRLWPLVEMSLADQRLLLLVDGLDEWSNDTAARIALQRLQVFIEQRHVPSVAASRPQGLNRTGISLAGWAVAELAGLTSEQQRRLALAWFRFREGHGGETPPDPAEADRRARGTAQSFFTELAKSADLGHLAQNPLLLTLLIYHRLHHARLPQTRFRANESLVEHLIAVHPQRRRAAALTTGGSGGLSEDDVKQVLSYLAFEVQSTASTGVLPVEEATQRVQTFLLDAEHGFGLNLAEARRLARWVTDVGEANLGVLVRQSPTDVGFIHRTFREFLAALHLSRMPLAKQEGVLRTNCANPQWREVVLCLFYCNKRPADVDQLVKALGEERNQAAPADRLGLESILCEAAFGEFNCSVRVARDLAAEAFNAIETGVRMSHRERLLSHALGGLSSTRVRDLLKEKLERWFPCWFTWRAAEYEAMGEWPAEPETVRTLWVGLFDEETRNKVGAARGLARIAREDEAIAKKLSGLARSNEDLLTRAVALYALVRGWPQLPENAELIDLARRLDSPDMRFAAIWAKSAFGTCDSPDLGELLSLAAPRSGLDYTFLREIPELLLAGWRGNPDLKAECLRALKMPPSPELTLDHELAWDVLLAGFPQDDDVADQVVHSLGEKPVFGGLLLQTDGWGLLAANFIGHPKLVGPLDRWIEAQEHAEKEVAQAALVGRTEIAKRKLLGMLAPGHFVYWPALALARGWGMGDTDVASAFSEILSSPPSNSCRFAHVFPAIVTDRTACRTVLLRLLRNPNCNRPDLVLATLKQFSQSGADTEVVDAALATDTEQPGVFWMDRDQFIYTLIEGFHRDPRVRQVAKESLESEFPPYSPIVRVYGNDAELRAMLRKRLSPLPDRLRLFIAQHLPAECPDQAFSIGLLSLYGREKDEAVKCQASLSYWHLLKERGEVTGEMRERLARDIVCYGFEHQEQRQAAFCGLATLGELDLMESARETSGEDRICAISLMVSSRANVPLLRCSVEHWSEIRATFGEEACMRLNHRSNDWNGLWDQLSPHADAFPAVREQILAFLESRPKRAASPNLLRFLARTRQKSELLLEYCLGTLHVGQDGIDVGGVMGEVASSLLGEHFAGNARALDQVLAGRAGECFYGRTVLALTEGWPDHPYLEAAYQAFREYEWKAGDLIWQRLVCSNGTVDEVLGELGYVCRARPIELRQQGFSIRPFVQRLRRDDELAVRLLALIRKDATPSEKASLARLLDAGQGASQELRAWCEKELLLQTRQLPAPETGLDILLKEERCVTQSLIDVLVASDTEVFNEE